MSNTSFEAICVVCSRTYSGERDTRRTPLCSRCQGLRQAIERQSNTKNLKRVLTEAEVQRLARSNTVSFGPYSYGDKSKGAK